MDYVIRSKDPRLSLRFTKTIYHEALDTVQQKSLVIMRLFGVWFPQNEMRHKVLTPQCTLNVGAYQWHCQSLLIIETEGKYMSLLMKQEN